MQSFLGQAFVRPKHCAACNLIKPCAACKFIKHCGHFTTVLLVGSLLVVGITVSPYASLPMYVLTLAAWSCIPRSHGEAESASRDVDYLSASVGIHCGEKTWLWLYVQQPDEQGNCIGIFTNLSCHAVAAGRDS